MTYTRWGIEDFKRPIEGLVIALPCVMSLNGSQYLAGLREKLTHSAALSAWILFSSRMSRARDLELDSTCHEGEYA